jgi:hypothetical protein
MNFRRVHLDFHTSEKIPAVGSRFNAKEFAKTLKDSCVDSITVFSKCHHGLSYHDTKVGLKHPGLKINLLDEMIESCAKEGITTPIYLSAGFDEYQAYKNPQWRRVSPYEKPQDNLRAGYKQMCFGTPYLDYLCSQLDEVMDRYNGSDGIFLDIIARWECVCPCCLKGMEQAGLDASKEEERLIYAQRTLDNYYIKTTEAVRNRRADCRIFHNSGHVRKGNRRILKYFSHLELESLPTGGWGYDHFPVSAKYASTLGMSFLGMTGKFHLSWGEFGGYKAPAALKYECASMIALGAECSVGDQLHPDGKLDGATYKLIGEAYRMVSEREEFCKDSAQVAEVAILSYEACNADYTNQYDVPDAGAGRMLLEKHILFDVVDAEADFSGYKALILPDHIRLDKTLKDKIETFLKKGGALIASGKSLLAADDNKFVIDFGADYIGESEWNPDYIAAGKLSGSMVESPFVMYERGEKIKPRGCEVLSKAWKPYFNRSFDHFCSHKHAPAESEADYPAAVKKGNIIYFAHPVFSAYKRIGQQLYRDLFYNALLTVFTPSLKINLPAAGRVYLTRQDKKKRYILHMIFGYKEMRGEDVQVIEETVPIFNITVELSLKEKAKKVKLEPEGKEIEFKQEKNTVTFTVAKVDMHRMVSIEY